jgi:hypothetical protein
MAIASDGLARRTSIRVVLMKRLKQRAARASSPMFNNRLMLGISKDQIVPVIVRVVTKNHGLTD